MQLTLKHLLIVTSIAVLGVGCGEPATPSPSTTRSNTPDSPSAGKPATERPQGVPASASTQQPEASTDSATPASSDQASAMWTPDRIPEAIVFQFCQEDLADGDVTTWPARGIKSIAATGLAKKLPNMGGVQFDAASSQQLAWNRDNTGLWLHRWWVVIARAHADGKADHIPLMTINGAMRGANHRQPVIRFDDKNNLQSLLDNGSPVMQQAPGNVDPQAWNIVVGFRRGGFYHAWINGKRQEPIPFTGMQPCDDKIQSYLGFDATSADPSRTGSVTIDCAMMGQGELSDVLIDKLVGWSHWRAQQQALLPDAHPYKQHPPTDGDESDLPTRFIFDQAAWDRWVETCDATRYEHGGSPAPSLDDGLGNDYRTVFFDDFRTDTVVDDLDGDASAIWYCPTHLSNVGVDAAAQKKSFSPSVYIHDSSDTGSLSLRLLDVNGRWKTGAFSSVNKEGLGRSWGKGRFRIRCRFPRMNSPRPGFFPAFWSYGTEHLFWRTRNRIEMDFFEYDGRNGAWLNTTQHIHAAPIVYQDPGIRQKPDVRYKISNHELNPKNNFASTIDIYDGQYHIWEFRIEDDYTYVIVDDHEVSRAPSTAWLIKPKYYMLDWALRNKEHPATSGETYDMTIDWIEVQQRERDLDDVPTAFKARPALTGERAIGKTITCTPNVDASQIEYRWYKNGEPIVGATEASFTEDSDSVTKNLRCSVQAVSLLNQPLAWTAEFP